MPSELHLLNKMDLENEAILQVLAGLLHHHIYPYPVYEYHFSGYVNVAIV